MAHEKLIKIIFEETTLWMLVDEHRTVIETCPLLSWVLGTDEAFVKRHYEKKGLKFTWSESPVEKPRKW